MSQYAGRLIVCVCLGAAALGVACGGRSERGGAGTAGAPAVAGAGDAPVTGEGGAPVGEGDAPFAGSGAALVAVAGAAGGGGSTVIGTPVSIDPDATGFVSAPKLGIQGAWYTFGDGMGPDGTAATSDCVAKGMHLPSECSTVTTPAFGPFTNTAGKMCTSGIAAKVINLTTGTMHCPSLSTDCDFSNLVGAGIGLDLNNAGADGGMGKLPFDAGAANIIGVQFTLEMLPLAGVRVEFPTDTTEDTAAIWKPRRAKNYTSPLIEGLNTIFFEDLVQPDFVRSPVAFDPSRLVSIRFHVPTSTTSSTAYNFCISGMSVLVE